MILSGRINVLIKNKNENSPPNAEFKNKFKKDPFFFN